MKQSWTNGQKKIKRLVTVQAVAQLPRAINAPALVEHLTEVKVGHQVWLVGCQLWGKVVMAEH